MLLGSNRNINNINNIGNGNKDDMLLGQLCAHIMSYRYPSQVMTRNGGSCE